VRPQSPGTEHVFTDTFGRLSRAVPDDVELGFHLCCGDLDAVHFVEPLDLRQAVELAHLVLASAGRPVFAESQERGLVGRPGHYSNSVPGAAAQRPGCP
jgi:hypothetical protein